MVVAARLKQWGSSWRFCRGVKGSRRREPVKIVSATVDVAATCTAIVAFRRMVAVILAVVLVLAVPEVER
jgi:hypothetical protein